MPVYIAEIAPENMRGSLGSVNQVEKLLLFLNPKSFLSIFISKGVDVLSLEFNIYVTFLAQLSVTIGIMLAYLLGLFANWRVLAILGKFLRIYLAQFLWIDKFNF